MSPAPNPDSSAGRNQADLLFIQWAGPHPGARGGSHCQRLRGRGGQPHQRRGAGQRQPGFTPGPSETGPGWLPGAPRAGEHPCHAPMVWFRGLADDLPLQSWLNDFIFPAEAAWLDPEKAYWGTRLARRR